MAAMYIPNIGLYQTGSHGQTSFSHASLRRECRAPGIDNGAVIKIDSAEDKSESRRADPFLRLQKAQSTLFMGKS